MKTLVYKDNPAIRMTAPEIEVHEEEDMYFIPVSDYCIPMCIDDWTLVEEEPAEGIKGNLEEIPSNVDLEKEMDKYYGMYRDRTGATYDIKDDEPCFDWKEDELSENKMRMARHFYELGLKGRKEE